MKTKTAKTKTAKTKTKTPPTAAALARLDAILDSAAVRAERLLVAIEPASHPDAKSPGWGAWGGRGSRAVRHSLQAAVRLTGKARGLLGNFDEDARKRTADAIVKGHPTPDLEAGQEADAAGEVLAMLAECHVRLAAYPPGHKNAAKLIDLAAKIKAAVERIDGATATHPKDDYASEVPDAWDRSEAFLRDLLTKLDTR